MDSSTQKAKIIEDFRANGWRLTLGQLLEKGRMSYAHKLTARFSDLRKDGYFIQFQRGETPAQNLYTMIPPVAGGIGPRKIEKGGAEVNLFSESEMSGQRLSEDSPLT